jgi:hypothetical protein
MEEYIDIEISHFSNEKFRIFTEACKKNGISSRDAINEFIDGYILDTFGTDTSLVGTDVEETIEEY